MTEMKEMVYQKDRKIQVLYSGEYKGYKFAILNLGVHPTAYIENKNGFYEYDEANEKTYNESFPHGGFTFLGKCYWDENDKTEYLGWDYAHCDDFSGYYTPESGLYDTKQWTTAEIYEDVKKTIDFLALLLKKKMSNQEIEDVLWACGRREPYCNECPLGCNSDNRRSYLVALDTLNYITQLKIDKLRAETQLRELLSALYKQTDNKNKSFTIYQSDIVELAKDYGIKEGDLN